MATIQIYGRLGKDPEVKFFDSGNVVAKFTLADSSGRKDDPTNWFDCEIWGKRAQILSDYVRKGHRLSVAGRVKTEEFTTKAGEARKKQVVSVDDFTLVESKAEASGSASEEEIAF